MDVAIPIFDQITALDAIGPYEVLSRLPRTRVHFLALEPGLMRTENGMLALCADGTLSSLQHPDVIVVPGGFGTRALMEDEQVLAWLRTAHESSQWTTSVCTGALVLAAAGILDGLEATTHWLLLDKLGELGATPGQPARRRAGQGDHRRRRVVGDRHGPDAGRPDRRGGHGVRDPAGDRVRPRAAVRQRVRGEGVGRGHEAGAGAIVTATGA